MEEIATVATTLWAKGKPKYRAKNPRNWERIKTCPRCGYEVENDQEYHISGRGNKHRRYHKQCWESMFI